MQTPTALPWKRFLYLLCMVALLTAVGISEFMSLAVPQLSLTVLYGDMKAQLLAEVEFTLQSSPVESETSAAIASLLGFATPPSPCPRLPQTRSLSQEASFLGAFPC